ncbi:TPA: hypothetical protein JMF69_001027 [Legionella pneumophila]|nr:hypothetical protein [Legionella pneumophila]HAW6263356.1 hypothetical protein [Legionella pneumophila]
MDVVINSGLFMGNICAVTEDNSHGQYKCQFEKLKLYTHEHKDYCKFHLPLSSPIKQELAYEKELEELINNGEDSFSYCNLSNLKICLSSLKLKNSLSFTLSTIDSLEIASCDEESLIINFFDCKIKNKLIFRDLSIRKIRFDNCEITLSIDDNYISILQLVYDAAVYFEKVKLNELIFENHTKIENNVFILTGCETNYLTISGTTILGKKQNFHFNIFTKFVMGAKVKTLTLSESSVYMFFELQNIDNICDLIFDKFLCFQAPCIRGIKEFSGKLALPAIIDCFVDDKSSGINHEVDENEKIAYWSRNFDHYKRLNKLAITNNLLNSETDFYVLSMRCIEKSRNSSDAVANIFNRIYDFSSSYGTNPSEVFFWYCFMLFIPSAIYQLDNIKVPLFEGLYSMTRLFNFTLIKSDKISLWSKIISTSQTISGIVLTALFAISLKWYFRKR